LILKHFLPEEISQACYTFVCRERQIRRWYLLCCFNIWSSGECNRCCDEAIRKQP